MEAGKRVRLDTARLAEPAPLSHGKRRPAGQRFSLQDTPPWNHTHRPVAGLLALGSQWDACLPGTGPV